MKLFHKFEVFTIFFTVFPLWKMVQNGSSIIIHSTNTDNLRCLPGWDILCNAYLHLHKILIYFTIAWRIDFIYWYWFIFLVIITLLVCCWHWQLTFTSRNTMVGYFWNLVELLNLDNRATYVDYRLITAYLLLQVNLDKIMHALRFWCIKCTNPKGACIGQASKLKHKCIILSKFSSTK